MLCVCVCVRCRLCSLAGLMRTCMYVCICVHRTMKMMCTTASPACLHALRAARMDWRNSSNICQPTPQPPCYFGVAPQRYTRTRMDIPSGLWTTSWARAMPACQIFASSRSTGTCRPLAHRQASRQAFTGSAVHRSEYCNRMEDIENPFTERSALAVSQISPSDRTALELYFMCWP